MLGHQEFRVKPFLLCVLCLLATSTAETLYKSSVGTPPTTSQSHYDHVIPVYGNFSITDCRKSQTDLNGSLREAFKYNKSVQLQLSEGCFTVTSNDLATFSGWTDFAIVGKGMDVSTITCGNGVGFTFLSSTRVVFHNVSIMRCSRVQNSTSKNFTISERLSFVQFWVGMYFLSCGDIIMDHVVVSDTNGVGVVMYNCNGTNTFNFSTFKVNFREDDVLSRSGNVAIEFTYCLPGDTTCKDNELPSFQVAQSTYTFYQCQFQYSSNFYEYNVPIVPYPHGTEHMAFGKGGGLSVIFKGRSSENSVIIDSCTLDDNSAQWGGGLYTSFADQSIDNSVTVVDSSLYMNIIPCHGNSPERHQSGGATQINFFYYPADNELWPGYQPNVLRNSVRFRKTDFASNVACLGGAVSIVISRETPGQLVTNSVLFDDCRFNYNQASIGAAIDVSVFRPYLVSSTGMLMAPVFKNCLFLQNGLHFSDNISFQPPTGVVLANAVPLNFSSVNNFTGNDGTAMVVSESFIALSESSTILFHSNTGRNGGALAFIGNSWLVVHKNTSMIFQNNTAESLGGAIFSVHFGEQDQIYKYNCFFQYYKATLHQSEWNATFKFTGNLAGNKSNSIYITSLSPCVWPGTPLKHTFCEHPWIFDNSSSSQCTRDVWTGPSSIQFQSVDGLSLVPGWKTWFNATLVNDLGYQIPSVFSAAAYKNQPGIEVNKSTEYIADNNIVVHGIPNRNISHNILVLRTLYPKVISGLLIVDIKECPFGYKQQNCTMPGCEHMACDCICANHISGIGCNDISHYIKVYHGSCLTYSYNGTNWSKPAVVGNCPYVIRDLLFHYNLSYDPVNLDRKVCKELHRTGFLCSKCIKGYGVDVNSYEFPCVKCKAQYSWFLFVLAELVPIVIFFITVTFLNVKMTSAPMNTFIFFSQIVTIPYFYTPYALMFGYLCFPYSKVLEALVAFPYALWNLNFFATAAIPGFCLHENLGTLEILALKYLSAFLPLLLIFVCYILIKLYDHNYRAIRFMWRPFQKCLKKIYKNRESKTSMIDVFSTFLLLSYSKVLFVSFSLFAFTSVRDASTNDVIGSPVFYFDASVPVFHGKYAILSITALIIFTLFVTLPPLFLIFYPFRCTQIVIDKLPFKIALRTFAETFNGDFRNGTNKDDDKDCRWFAGYYFLLRVIVFIIYVSELRWLDQYFVQQVLFAICIILFANIRPYKKNYYNKLDTAMFTLLALLNAFSLYNSQHYHSYSSINNVVFWINYLLIFLPLVFIICYIVYLILLWKGCLKQLNKSTPLASSSPIKDPSSIDDDEMSETYNSLRGSDEDIPDRLVNPQNYNSRNLYRPFDPQSVSHKKQKRPRQGSSEKSYFYCKRDRKMVPYGSLSSTVPREHHSEPALPEEKRANDSTNGRSSDGKRNGIHFKGDV